MKNPSFTTTFAVGQTPAEAFNAINNVRGWWSEEIEGNTGTPGDEFTYRYKDVHICKLRVIEVIPDKKVVWLVLDNHFNFTEDESEWTGTKITFEVSRKDDTTEVHFSHLGLVPEYECYGVCSNAWGSYINGSLRSLITAGKGRPNPKEQKAGFTTTFSVDQTPQEVFDAINNVRGWWSEEIEGSTDKLGARFEFHYKDVHRSTQEITELAPGKKVVWHITEAQLNFVKDKTEWKGTDVVFEIARKGDKTELRFTHLGLVPTFECYGDCSGAWGFYINDSLRSLITTGKGQPAGKE